MKTKHCSFLILLLVVCCLFLSAYSRRFSREGLNELYNRGEGLSSFSITSEIFVEKSFMDDYPHENGNFHYDCYESALFMGTTERSFAWMSYDVETYKKAKGTMLASRGEGEARFDAQTAFGYTFYMNYEYSFPDWFTAFGYNDDTATLAFIGLYLDSDSSEFAYCPLAETDLGEFLRHFYGEWYDWEHGCEWQ